RPARVARHRIGRSPLDQGLDRRIGGHRLPAARAGHDRRLALPGGRGALRRDGLAAPLAGRRRRRRPADRPRGGRPRELPMVRRAAERPSNRGSGLAGHRRPIKGNPQDAREDPRVIDWIIAKRIATFVAGTGTQPPEAHTPKSDLAALAAESESRVVAYTGLTP